MMISCKKASELASRAQDAPLNAWQRLQLRLHYLLCSCPICRSFFSQIKLLGKACQVYSEKLEEGEALRNCCLSPEARGRIEAALTGNRKDSASEEA